MTTERFTFKGHSGHELAARLDLPDGPHLATALFAHCFTCGKDITAARRIASRLPAPCYRWPPSSAPRGRHPGAVRRRGRTLGEDPAAIEQQAQYRHHEDDDGERQPKVQAQAVNRHVDDGLVQEQPADGDAGKTCRLAPMSHRAASG